MIYVMVVWLWICVSPILSETLKDKGRFQVILESGDLLDFNTKVLKSEDVHDFSVTSGSR